MANINASNVRNSKRNIVAGGEQGEHWRHSLRTHSAKEDKTKKIAWTDIDAIQNY